MSIWTDPAKLPADRARIPDGDLITADVWAVLQGVSKVTVESNLSKSRKRRAAGEARPGDMPEPDDRAGQTPLFTFATYRAWARARPGKGSSLGKGGGPGARGGTGGGKRVRLPIECPHCHREVTEADLDAAVRALEAFGALRDGGVAAADAAGQLGLSGPAARRLEMAWRGSVRRGPLEAEGRRAIG